jgi:hypothetical protein
MTASPNLVTPPQRLSRLLKEAGGVSVRSALLDAKREVGTLKDKCRVELDSRLLAVNATFAGLADRATPERIQNLYDTTNHMVGLGVVAGRPAFDAAALSLCALLDRMIRAEAYDAAAVEVHVTAFRLLLKAEGDIQATAKIVAGLQQISGRKADASAA